MALFSYKKGGNYKVFNQKVREAIKTSGLKYWQVADLLEISPSWLSVKLRHELTDKEAQKIIRTINGATTDHAKKTN